MTFVSALVTMLIVAVQAGAWRASSAEVAIEQGSSTVTVRNTGHAGVDLWRTGDSAVSGSYTVRATLRKTAGRRREGYGFLFGGRALGTDDATYAYVMLRGDGALLIKKREGASLTVIRDWTPAPAIRADDAQGRAENVLEVRVGPREVAVSVNGTAVATVPAAGIPADGVIGLRVSHTVALEVTGLEVRR
jgi:hypothetical protein